MKEQESQRPLLSICIPTYNRANQMKRSLECFVKAIQGYEEYVELIVSDNCSEDNTKEVIEKNYVHYPFLKYYRNSSNLGFNKNMFLLVDVYATGKYCWVVGDDDYVDIDSVATIVNAVLQNPSLKYLFLNHRRLTEKQYIHFLKLQHRVSESHQLMFDSFFRVLDKNVSLGCVLGTFISSTVFYRIDFVNYSKTQFSAETWNKFYDVFPNGYLMATLFHKELVAYVKEPLLTVILGSASSWSHYLGLIFRKYLPDLFDYCLQLGCNRKDLKNTEDLLILKNFRDSVSLLLRFRRISLLEIKWIVKFIISPRLFLRLIVKTASRLCSKKRMFVFGTTSYKQ